MNTEVTESDVCAFIEQKRLELGLRRLSVSSNTWGHSLGAAAEFSCYPTWVDVDGEEHSTPLNSLKEVKEWVENMRQEHSPETALERKKAALVKLRAEIAELEVKRTEAVSA